MTLPTYLSLFCYEQNLTSLSRSADLTILCAKKRRVSQETSVRITKTTPASLFSTRPSVTSAPAMSSPCQLPRFNTPFYYIYTHLHFLMSCLVTHQKSSNNNSFELITRLAHTKALDNALGANGSLRSVSLTEELVFGLVLSTPPARLPWLMTPRLVSSMGPRLTSTSLSP